MQGAVLIAVDGSDRSQLALSEGGIAAKRFGQRVTVVFVRHSCLWAVHDSMVDQMAIAEEGLATLEVITEAQGIAVLDALEVSWDFVVGSGRPLIEVLEAANSRQAHLIVVADDRKKAISRVARPSLAQQLRRRWPHDLLVV